MGKLDGKIALVTGGNSGIGLATARQFVSEGAYVFITARRDAQLAAAVKEIGRNVTGVQGDVSNLADLDRLFGQIKREKGKLDIVFANAGVAKYALWLPRTQIRAYRWCSPPRIGSAIMSPNRSIGRVQGASLPSERCVRTSL